MPRQDLIRTAEFPYHIRARANNREPWPVPMERVWDIFSEVHSQVVKDYGFLSHAFTLMNNHYHWTASTPNENLDEGMRFFQAQTSKKIAKSSGRINRIYGGRYGWSLLPSPDSFQRTFRYVHMNPVRAGVCASPIHYPWSTLVNRGIDVVEAEGFTDGMPQTPAALAKWMLDLREVDDEVRIRRALRRKVFNFPRAPSGFMDR